MVNDKIARASYSVKIGDVIEIGMGKTPLKVKVLKIAETVRKEETAEMYEVV
jgi:ribosomal 50S subunit-recycling heat shock protein